MKVQANYPEAARQHFVKEVNVVYAFWAYLNT